MLWSGGYHSHEGKHYTVHDARIFTLPDEPPPVHVAVSGAKSIALAARAGGGMVAVQPSSELTKAFDEAARERPAEVRADRRLGRRRRGHGAAVRARAVPLRGAGWKVMAELPNPINFEAATTHVREEDVAENITCGPDVDRHADAIRKWSDAGFDRVAVVQVGEPERFFQMWESELRPRLQSQ